MGTNIACYLLNHLKTDTLKEMKTLLYLLLLFVFGASLVTTASGQTNAPLGWQIVGEGIEYQKFRLTNPVPVDVFVARMERDNPAVTIESSLAQGRISGGVETVSGMAARYDGALNFWGPPSTPVSPTWGATNQVVVAINGFYFGGDVEPPGVPWSGQIHSAWYTKRYSDTESLSGFVWNTDRSAFVGECISHPEDKQYVYNTTSGGYLYLDGLNRSREADELILYTPQYDRDTGTGSGAEVLIEMEHPTSISVFSNMPYGVVRQVRNYGNSTPNPFNHVVLSGSGSRADDLRNNFQVGDTIGIAQRVKDCIQFPNHNWYQTYAGVGGQFYFLRDGVIYPYSDKGEAVVRDPRTAIAYNEQYIFFIVADGRNPGISEGMNVAEMAEFAKNTLGATHGIMQDGGGSSTMVINGQVVNNTYCNNVYCTPKIYLPLVIKSGSSTAAQPTHPPEPLTAWDAQALQRLVANGMMMVVVQPQQNSSQPHDPGDPVTTVGTATILLGPGNNYAALDTIDGNGVILASSNNLDGVYATDHYWWLVDFGTIEGWVAEEQIAPQIKLTKSRFEKAH